jgi:hypothetical protein
MAGSGAGTGLPGRVRLPGHLVGPLPRPPPRDLNAPRLEVEAVKFSEFPVSAEAND